MCVASKKPLIESGTAGYLGQVEPLLPIPPHEGNLDKNNCVKVQLQTACYECQSRAADQRTYPACTIRNTPSEPIHCVIWAKYLFNQLFGEPDVSDEDVSPDLNDPELKLTSSDVTSFTHSLNNSESVSGLSSTTLRDWFQKLWKMNASGDHSPPLHVAARSLVWRLFHDDISTLTSMRDLWVDRQDRREPSVLRASALDEAVSSKAASQPTLSASTCELRDQCTLSLTGWLRLFMDSVLALQNRFISGSCKALTWDKDDAEAMDFVASASIIRSMLFHLPGADKLTRFIIKSLAGNIIPAIATTNAIVAGLMVLQARQIVLGNSHNIKTLYLHRQSTGRAGNRRVVVPCQPPHPNPHCLVCSAKATKSMLGFHCCPSRLTLRTLRDQILIRHLGMLAPDVELEDRNIILISSEDGETDEATLNKTLTEFNVTHGSRLRCDDFLQDFTVSLVVSTVTPATLASSDHSDSQETTETTWQLVGDMQAARAEVNSNKEISTKLRVPNGTIEPVVSSDEAVNTRSSKRTSHTEEDADLQPTVHKRARMDSVGSNTDECVEIDEDDDLILLE
ncbi:unnamed protein product [Dicrocoelium dendriticum]|nr:unnamed protein product [Dicrocoelium dendriticum]